MEKLPPEIESIILDYKVEMEQCQYKMDRAMEVFFMIQSRAEGIVNDLQLCQCGQSKQLCKVLMSIIREATSIMARILQEDSITVQQTKILSNLQHEVFVEVMDSTLYPFFVHITEMPQEPTYNDESEEDVP